MPGLMRRLVIAALLITAGLLESTSSTEAQGWTAGGSAGNGVHVSVSLDRAAYPWHALARATITVKNDSTDQASGWSVQRCPGPVPDVTEWNSRGQRVGTTGVEAIVPCMPDQGGGSVRPAISAAHVAGVRIAPGASRQWTRFVVLNGARLATRVSVALISGNTVVWGGWLWSPRAHVRFTHGSKPRVRFCTCGAVCAHISPAPGTHPSGPMYFASVDGIAERSSGAEIACRQILTTRPAPRTTITPACGKPNLWYFMAGWLNHRVIDMTVKRIARDDNDKQVARYQLFATMVAFPFDADLSHVSRLTSL